MKRWMSGMNSSFMLYLILFFAKVTFVRFIIFENNQLFYSFLIEVPMLILIIGIVELVFKRQKRWIYFAINIVVSFCLFTITVYYQYFGAIVTYNALGSIGQAKDITDSIFLIIKPSFYLLLIDIPIIFVALLVRKNTALNSLPTGEWVRSKYGTGVMILSLVLVVSHVLNSIDGSIVNELRKAERMGIIAYEAYIVYADVKGGYIPVYDVNLRQIQSEKRIIERANPEYYGIGKDMDIYLVQLEAFQNFLIGKKVRGREVTPVLNQLIEESFYFPNVFQQIGKGNTSDAEFITNTSIYTMGELAMSSQVAQLEVPSMPRYLKPYGYESVTLHTNDVRFWDRDKLYPALGFDHAYDAEYFGDEDFIAFGASDEVLYRKSMDIFVDMKNRKQKIYANLIAMSSHGPFDIPEEKNLFRLPRDLQDTILGKYLQAGHYADYALGKFIEDLKEQGLWDTALLLVNGDHFGFSYQFPEEETQLAAQFIGVDNYLQVEAFNIPLIIRVPGHTEAVVIETVGGQVDYLPTLANFIGLPMHDKIYFGQDLVNHPNNLLPMRIYLPTGSFINDEFMFIPGRSFDDGFARPLDQSKSLPDLERYRNDFQRALRLSEMSEVYLKSLPPLEASE